MCILCRHFQWQVKTLSVKDEYRGAFVSSFYISSEIFQQDLQLIELHMKVLRKCLVSFPGSSVPERDIEVVHALREESLFFFLT